MTILTFMLILFCIFSCEAKKQPCYKQGGLSYCAGQAIRDIKGPFEAGANSPKVAK